MKHAILPVILLLTVTQVASAQDGPSLPKDFGHELTNSEKAALFMWGLYSKGLAGGDTGICVEYDGSQSGSLRLGIDTKAFSLGKSGITDSASGGSSVLNGEMSDRIKNLRKFLNTVADKQSQNSPLRVVGYADGTGVLPDGESLSESVRGNEQLSLSRADTILCVLRGGKIVYEERKFGSASLQLFKACEGGNAISSKLTTQASKGYASDQLEGYYRKNKTPWAERSCPTRRKVVMELGVKLPEVQVSAKGDVTMAPRSMDLSEEMGIRNYAFEKIDRALAAGKNEKEVFDRLMSAKPAVLSKACAQNFAGINNNKGNPLYSITLALIRYAKKHPASPGASPEDRDARVKVKVEELLEDATLMKELKAAGYLPPNPNKGDGGTPTILFACFLPDSSLKTSRNGDRKSGTEFLKNQDLALIDGQQVSVGYKIPAAVDETHVHSTEFKCQACKSGLEINTRKQKADGNLVDVVENTRYRDRFLNGNNVGEVLNALSKTDPNAFGASLKSRTYFIPNCDCGDGAGNGGSCDPSQHLNDPGVGVFDPMASAKNLSASKAAVDLKKGCVYSPPMLPTCGVDPNAVSKKSENGFVGGITVDDGVNESLTVANYEELVARMKQTEHEAKVQCTQHSTPQEKVNSVVCNRSNGSALPSQDQGKDCKVAL